MRIGIAIDDWKLPIFKQHLDSAGFAYTQGKGLTDDTLFLYVETDDPGTLGNVVRAAATEAARRKKMN